MPKVRASSGTIGTTRWPICLSRSSVLSICTNAIVVEISRSPVPLEQAVEGARASGTARARVDRCAGARQVAAERLAALVQVLHLRAVLGERKNGTLGELLVGDRDVEAVAELAAAPRRPSSSAGG